MLLTTYNNGNSIIEIKEDGTRIISYEGNLILDYPLNIDIRVSTKCSFGLNPIDGTSFCDFCHESALTNGNETDYVILKEKLTTLPSGIELAIGANNLTDKLIDFLKWSKNKGFICNVTINQGHLLRDKNKILYCINNGYIKGLGVSYRSSLKWTVPSEILKYENTVFHVISGIDDITDVLSLKEKGVEKILILGEKDFGFNLNKVDLKSKKHKLWYWWISDLFNNFKVVSFDNLSIEQLNMKRFFQQEKWEIFNQGEHSFYINSVEGYFSPSSRNKNRTNWDDVTIKEYFKNKIMG